MRDDETAIPDRLLRLAPAALPRRNDERYAGEGFAVPLQAFGPADVRRLRMAYDRCQAIYDAWLVERDRPDWPGVHEAVAALTEPGFIEEVQRLGDATVDPPAAVARVLHDVRSGALAGLIAEAEVLGSEDPTRVVRDAVLLGRDHAKMMRQAIVDLDPEGRAADARERRHDLDDVARKWDRHRYSARDSVARVRVDCRAEGGLASRCLEAAAVDRVLYNLINNATRFAAHGVLDLHILGIGRDIRFVVVNDVTEDQAAWLERETGGDLGVLFRGGTTRAGQGLGLVNCAELVAAAYGLMGPSDAVRDGYIGAMLSDGLYHAWFHWPRYEGTARPP